MLTNEGKVQQLERSGESHAVTRLETSQANHLAHVLSRVSHEEPRFTYTLPDEEERRAALPRILSSAIRVSHLSGETYTTPDIGGGALWIAPGRTFTLQQLTGLRLPSQLGTQGLERWVMLSAHLAQVRQHLAGTHHWYLIALGVEPSKRRRGIGGALIQPVLSRADADGIPCYVETFQGPNLSFYEEHGFR